jgi:WD40 repeat protein
MKGKVGQFGKNCNILTSLIVANDKIYTGASDGSLHTWQGNSITKSQKIHTKSLNVLNYKNNILVTGSSDCTIKILDINSLAELSSINCK